MSLTADLFPDHPWCWYIYLQNWVIYGVNVSKYTSTMDDLLFEEQEQEQEDSNAHGEVSRTQEEPSSNAQVQQGPPRRRLRGKSTPPPAWEAPAIAVPGYTNRM